ncbi:hypothetical protein LINPERPRIM_LOCUS82, partial [Linum perenne]
VHQPSLVLHTSALQPFLSLHSSTAIHLLLLPPRQPWPHLPSILLVILLTNRAHLDQKSISTCFYGSTAFA